MDGVNDNSLSMAFHDSLAEDTMGCIGDYVELGIDSILDEGLLKDMPLVSTAVTLYKFGDNIRDRHNLKKLVAFLDEINKGIMDNEQRLRYQNKFRTNEKFRNEQLEYLLVLIDRYTTYDKPRMLAKLYMAYLDEKSNWQEFLVYAEVIDRFLSEDYDTLILETKAVNISNNTEVSVSGKYVFHNNIGIESVLRLVALGLVAEDSNNSMFDPDGRGGFAITNVSMQRLALKQRTFSWTKFGEKLANILR